MTITPLITSLSTLTCICPATIAASSGLARAMSPTPVPGRWFSLSIPIWATSTMASTWPWICWITFFTACTGSVNVRPSMRSVPLANSAVIGVSMPIMPIFTPWRSTIL
ncbi:hypothetical protein D3C76_1280450 [compost metagenome]